MHSPIIILISGHPNQIRGIYYYSTETQLPNGSYFVPYFVRVLKEANLVVKAANNNHSFYELGSNTEKKMVKQSLRGEREQYLHT